MRWMRYAVLLLLSVGPLSAGVAACAQVFDLDHDRQSAVELRGLWKFQPGDDPRYARPDFDDAGWAMLRSDTDWAAQGYKDLGGVAWYRFKLVIPEHSAPLALYISKLMTTYEVYEDGVKVGGYGPMPPDPSPYHAIPQVVPLRESGVAHTATIAIRVWHWPGWATYYGGGPHAAVMAGAAPLMQAMATDEQTRVSWKIVDQIVLIVLEGLAGLAALGFYYARKREREYLWFGVMLLSSAFSRSFTNWALLHPMSVLVRDNVSNIPVLAVALSSIAFYMRLLHGKRNWVFWLAVASVVGTTITGFLDGPLFSVRQSQEIAAVLMLPSSAWLLALLIRQARRGVADARLLLLPVLLQQLALLAGNLVWLSYLAGWQRTTAVQDLVIANWPFLITATDVSSALFLLAMLAILMIRFTRIRREEERLETELEAARSVQLLLIPEDLPFVPGLRIASAYKPASEVGGDFYQVIPMADLGHAADDQSGGALVVVGDVSGKGLQAAMTVSLIVGSLRTLVDHTQRPKEILEGLNRRLFERSGGGFTTCLVMRIDADGRLVAASAGHLPPYRNGRELPLEDGLPLGLTLDAEYEESCFTLAEGDHMMLISDGVLEARSHTGELYGFDRTRALSMQDAAHAALAAQAFGQEDDITVLTLERTADRTTKAVEMVEASQ